MHVEPKQIDLYELPNGEAPFDQWLNGLRDRQARARIDVRLGRVRLGNLGDTRDVGEGVHELKVDYGPGYRLYYANAGRRILLLLCGGDKSTQAADIKRAQQYWADFKARQGSEERSER